MGLNYQVELVLPGGNNLRSSTSQTLSYLAPTITAVGTQPVVLAGGDTLTVTGKRTWLSRVLDGIYLTRAHEMNE